MACCGRGKKSSFAQKKQMKIEAIKQKSPNHAVLPTHVAIPGEDAGSVNPDLLIQAVDAPGSGNAHHLYHIAHNLPQGGPGVKLHAVKFQNGPIKEAGINGLTNEALLAIVIHRLTCFQEGPFACTHNQEAKDHLLRALETLQDRTKERVERNVEGTHEV